MRGSGYAATALVLATSSAMLLATGKLALYLLIALAVVWAVSLRSRK